MGSAILPHDLAAFANDAPVAWQRTAFARAASPDEAKRRDFLSTVSDVALQFAVRKSVTTMVPRFIVLRHDPYGFAGNQRVDVHWSVASVASVAPRVSTNCCAFLGIGAKDRMGAASRARQKMGFWRLTA